VDQAAGLGARVAKSDARTARSGVQEARSSAPLKGSAAAVECYGGGAIVRR
jgi:hypothetical protein